MANAGELVAQRGVTLGARRATAERADDDGGDDPTEKRAHEIDPDVGKPAGDEGRRQRSRGVHGRAAEVRASRPATDGRAGRDGLA
jgi:hypothetical protein